MCVHPIANRSVGMNGACTMVTSDRSEDSDPGQKASKLLTLTTQSMVRVNHSRDATLMWLYLASLLFPQSLAASCLTEIERQASRAILIKGGL